MVKDPIATKKDPTRKDENRVQKEAKRKVIWFQQRTVSKVEEVSETNILDFQIKRSSNYQKVVYDIPTNVKVEIKIKEDNDYLVVKAKDINLLACIRREWKDKIEYQNNMSNNFIECYIRFQNIIYHIIIFFSSSCPTILKIFSIVFTIYTISF